jgi:hypothetical protein
MGAGMHGLSPLQLQQQHVPAQLEQRVKAQLLQQQSNLQSNFQSNMQSNLLQMHMGGMQSNSPQQGSWTDEQLMLAQLLQGGQQLLDFLQEQQQQRQCSGSRQR